MPARSSPIAPEFREAQRRLSGVAAELAAAVGGVSECTNAHAARVAGLAVAVGCELGLDTEALENLHLLGLMHDIGKIAIDPAVVAKPGPLTAAEIEQVRSHPVIGAQMILHAPDFSHLHDPIRHHHERFDGGGYPDGLGGDDLDADTHILIACDAYDAMTCRRPYRPAMSLQQAACELRECAGTQFEPEVVAALLTIIRVERAAA
jgi:HD-GYP domain-containing protein (c-di-GMP phosphodiesterase class II)